MAIETSIVPRKSDKEVIQELVEIVFDLINNEKGGSKIMFMPAINIVKLKLSQMDEMSSADIIDKVHRISRHLEQETGRLSPYHGIDE
jgi:hypothetical protein